MTRHKVVTAVAGMAAILLALTACGPPGSEPGAESPRPASASPGSDISASPTSTPEPSVPPAAVIVDGDSVSVTASDGGVLIDIPFTTDPLTAVSTLSDTIGLSGTLSTLPETMCYYERQKATWGGLTFIWGPDWRRAPGALFVAEVTGAEARSGLKLTLPSGHVVGTSGTTVLAANASAPFADHGEWIDLRYDVISGTETGDMDFYYGANALIVGGELKAFHSPIFYNYDC